MRRKSQVAGDLFKGSFNRFKAAVRVDIQRHTGIRVSHQVLQAFYIQPGLLNIGSEGVSQHMFDGFLPERVSMNPLDRGVVRPK